MRSGTDSQHWFDDDALQKLLDEHTDSTVVGGNSVRLLINGEQSFARRHQNVSTAIFILVKTFIWTDDDAGRRMADAIAAKARAGVPVIIQYDVKGNIGGLADAADMLSRTSAKLPAGEPLVMADLRAAGALIIDANSPGRPIAIKEWADNVKRLFRDPKAALTRSLESLQLFDHADHDKYFITVHDRGEVRAIMGGLNIASEYAFGGIPNKVDSASKRGGWRDTDIEIQGPCAHLIIDEFLADAKRHRGEPIPRDWLEKLWATASSRQQARGNVSIRVVVNNPLTDKTRHMDDLYRILVLATPKNEPIYLSTPYFAPSKRLRTAMLKHMEGGGTITVLTNSYESSDIDILTDAARYTARELSVTNRFRLFERIPRPDLGEVMLHHKLGTFGYHGPVIIGSANLDAQSFVHNGEAVVVIDDPSLRRQFDEMAILDRSPDRARLITRDELESASMLERMRSFAAGKFAWYWL